MPQENDFEELSQDLESKTTEYTAPVDKDIRWMFDYDMLIWEIRAKLMGGWTTEGTDKKIKIVRPRGVKPMMNQTGIEQTIGIVRGFVSIVQGLSYVDAERINVLNKELAIALDKEYYINLEKFDMTLMGWSLAKQMVLSLVEFNMRKSLAGNSMRMIGQTETSTTIRNEGHKGGFHLPFIGGKK